MKTLDALNILNDLSSSQKGVFTTAQAEDAGVGRLLLSRLTSYGQLERLDHGVYRSCAAPSFRESRVYAAWLGLEPAIAPYERPKNSEDCVASHGTAAWMHDLGEVNPEPLTFTCSKRKQTKRSGLKLVKGNLEDNEVEIVAGIPVTTPARTILDLIEAGEDLSLVANVLADALAADPTMATQNFVQTVNARAKRAGFSSDFPLFDYLRKG